MNQKRRPLGITLLVIFFAAGALICIVVMLALAFPGSFLEMIWRLRPEVRDEFIDHGTWSIALMAAVGAGCGLAAFGLARGAGGDAAWPSGSSLSISSATLSTRSSFTIPAP